MIPLFEFTGGQELQKALDSLPARVSKRFQLEALEHAAEPMRRQMEMLAPVEPGKPDLRDTIVISRARGVDAKETLVAVGPSRKGWYGSFQEFGTAHHAPQPFVRPAFAQKAGEAMRRLAADIWVSLAGRGIQRTSTANVVVMGEEV